MTHCIPAPNAKLQPHALQQRFGRVSDRAAVSIAAAVKVLSESCDDMEVVESAQVLAAYCSISLAHCTCSHECGALVPLLTHIGQGSLKVSTHQ